VPVTRRHSTWLGSRLSRHPHERYQLCYRPGTRQRSAGIFLTRRRALAEKRVIERGRIELAVAADFDLKQKARTLFGEFVATKWWPAWKDQHPTAEDGTRKKVEKRILPALGDIPLGDLDQAPSAPGSPPGGLVWLAIRVGAVSAGAGSLGVAVQLVLPEGTRVEAHHAAAGPHAAELCRDGDHRRCNQYGKPSCIMATLPFSSTWPSGEGCVAVQRRWGCAPVSLRIGGMGQANSTSRRQRHTSARTILG
jgi:hypothetical protein